jgi:hypothetical protein
LGIAPVQLEFLVRLALISTWEMVKFLRIGGMTMNKQKRIRHLERELQQAHDDYQHTHDSLWKMLAVLCDEFGLKLSIQAKENHGGI